MLQVGRILENSDEVPIGRLLRICERKQPVLPPWKQDQEDRQFTGYVDLSEMLTDLGVDVIKVAYLLLFRWSVSGRCCLDGSSIHQRIFCCSSHSSDTSSNPVLNILLPRSFCPSSVSLAFHFSPVFGVFCVCPKQLFCFLLQFRNVPEVTPRSSEMDWFVMCSVHDTGNGRIIYAHYEYHGLNIGYYVCFMTHISWAKPFADSWRCRSSMLGIVHLCNHAIGI